MIAIDISIPKRVVRKGFPFHPKKLLLQIWRKTQNSKKNKNMKKKIKLCANTYVDGIYLEK